MHDGRMTDARHTPVVSLATGGDHRLGVRPIANWRSYLR